MTTHPRGLETIRGELPWSALFPDLAADALDELLRWVDRRSAEDHARWPQVETHPALGPHDDGALLAVISPLADGAVADARCLLTALGPRIDLPAIAERLRGLARSVIAEELLRPLLGLLVADSEVGHTSGGTPEERYARWLQDLGTPRGWQRMRRARGETVDRAVGIARERTVACAELVAHTVHRREAIGRSLGRDRDERGLGIINDLVVTGDPHGGGRQVVVMTAASGRKVVAKPRSAVLDDAYARLVAEIARGALDLDLPPPRWHHGDAGEDLSWMEFLDSPAHRHRDYYPAIGAHLGALHVTRGTDIHYENLLTDASGLPVVVDAEALMTPRLIASPTLDVDATGMLSVLLDSGFDAGALDYRPGTESPFRSLQIQRPGRDDIALAPATFDVVHPAPAPGPAPARADAERMREAFIASATWVVRHRDDVAGRLSALPSANTRLVHRPTMAYALVQRMATHPSFAGRRDRWRALARLAALPPATPRALLRSELRQLDEGDLPAFRVDLRERIVRDARGRDTGVRTAATPLQDVLTQLDGLDDAAVDRQAQIVERATDHWT